MVWWQQSSEHQLAVVKRKSSGRCSNACSMGVNSTGGLILRVEGGETRAVAIRSSDRAEEMDPRPYSGTLLAASLTSGSTVRLEENPEVEQAESRIAPGRDR